MAGIPGRALAFPMINKYLIKSKMRARFTKLQQASLR